MLTFDESEFDSDVSKFDYLSAEVDELVEVAAKLDGALPPAAGCPHSRLFTSFAVRCSAVRVRADGLDGERRSEVQNRASIQSLCRLRFANTLLQVVFCLGVVQSILVLFGQMLFPSLYEQIDSINLGLGNDVPSECLIKAGDSWDDKLDTVCHQMSCGHRNESWSRVTLKASGLPEPLCD